jgi:hypothetical protein
MLASSLDLKDAQNPEAIILYIINDHNRIDINLRCQFAP